MDWLLDPGANLLLRKLVPQDTEPVVELAAQAFGYKTSAEVQAMLGIYCQTGMFAIPLEQQNNTLLQVSYYLLVQKRSEGEVRLGLTGLYRPVWAGQGVYWLGWFAVDPAYQGRGYGSRLLDASLALAKKKDGRILCVETSSTLAVARYIYQRAGFKTCGGITDYWGPGEDLLILTRPLADILIPQGVPDGFK